jgi:serine O-acetyltransferase
VGQVITNKKDYIKYVQADKEAMNASAKRSILLSVASKIAGGGEIVSFLSLLRKLEYYQNCKKSRIHIPYRLYLLRKFNKQSIRLGFTIYPNCFDAGLSISHHGTIVVSPESKIGYNCRINPGVVIGNNRYKGPRIGNNVFIGSGAKIIGDIELADGIAVGANSVVRQSFLEPNITIAGIPAKKVSDNGSKVNWKHRHF